MITRHKKCFLLALSALVLAACLLPAPAFAEGNILTVGANGNHQSLQEAFENATDGDTIVLEENVAVDSVITVEKAVTLNLNGFTITNNVRKDRPFSIKAPNFTVDGTSSGSGMVIPEGNTASYGFIKLIQPSVLTLNGGTYAGNTDKGAFILVCNRPSGSEVFNASGSTVVLNSVNMTSNGQFFNTDTLSTNVSTPTLQVTGGTYISEGKAFGVDTIDRSPVTFTDAVVTAGTGPCIEVGGSEATFNNCVFTVTGGSPNAFATTAVAASWSGSVTINGGTYSAPNGFGVYVYNSGGIIVVNSGTISGGGAAVAADRNVQTSHGSSQQSTVIVKGGETIGAWQRNSDEALLSALGGSHTANISNYIQANAAILISGDKEQSLYSVYSSLEDALGAGGAYVVKDGNGATMVFIDKEKADAFAEENGSETPEAVMRTVHFDDRIDATSDQYVQVLNGQTVAKPENDPVLEGYRFLGWYEYDSVTNTYASKPFDFSTPIMADLTLYAQWEKVAAPNDGETQDDETPEAVMRTVHFDDRIDATSDQYVQVLNGQTVAKPENDPVLEGYRFLGWYEYDSATNTYASKPFDFSTPIMADLTLYAQWEKVAAPNDGETQDGETLGSVTDGTVPFDGQSDAGQPLPQTGDNQIVAFALIGFAVLTLAFAAAISRKETRYHS